MTASTVSLSENPCNACNVNHRGHHINRHAGPTPTRREQIREHLIGEQLTTMRRQKPKDTLPGFRRCLATDSASNNSR